MNFLVILTKNHADLLYIPVLACSPLKRAMYVVNVSDMFRNIILKIQTGLFGCLDVFFWKRTYLNEKQFHPPMKRKSFRSFV